MQVANKSGQEGQPPNHGFFPRTGRDVSLHDILTVSPYPFGTEHIVTGVIALAATVVSEGSISFDFFHLDIRLNIERYFTGGT